MLCKILSKVLPIDQTSKCSCILFFCLLLEFVATFVQGKIEVCHYVKSPFLVNHPENCSLICSFKFQHAVSGIQYEEVPLCIKNTSLAVFCDNNYSNDCGLYHAKAFCKLIPCLCKVKHGSSESYIIDSSLKIPRLHTCVLPLSQVNPDMTIIPFPWQTLVIVMGVVFAFALLLVCVRWLSPVIRSMQSKRTTRPPQPQSTNQQSPENDPNLFLPSRSVDEDDDHIAFTHYFPRGMPRIYRANPRSSQRGGYTRSQRSSAANRVRYAQVAGGRTDTLGNQDKPPAYEAAIQLPPPAYEDVERALQERRHQELQTISQRAEIHAEPATSPSAV